MTTQISKSKFLYFTVLLFIICSCQNKTAPSTQHTEEKANDEKMEKITELYNSGNYVEFIKLAEAKLSKSENDFGFFLALSDAYGSIGNFDKAFYFARRLLIKEPNNYYALLAIGNYHLLLAKLDSAEYYYNRVLQIRPSYARANLNLAQLYEKQNEKGKAIEQYLKAIELFKENNFIDEVKLYSKQILKLDPKNKSAIEYLVPPNLKK
ncbi:MAG: hypothetical protein NTV75_03765 [Bacteroidia bacterium]|nr:hypothetical protein [Bacteroidia bacterium]